MASPSRAPRAALTVLALAASSGIVVVAGPAANAATSSVSAAASANTITLDRTSAQRAESGTKVRFAGTAPSLVGKRIVLQRKGGGGGWKVVGAGRVSGSGTYAISGKAKGAGVNAFRTYVVTKVAKKGKKRVETKAYSPKRSVWSLDWFHLYDTNNRTQRNYNRYVADVGGKKFTKSFGTRAGSGSGWVEINLGGTCDTLRASIGQDDISTRGTTSRFAVRRDGVEADLGVKGRGKARTVALDVTGVSTLRLASAPESGSALAWAIWSNPRVLCQRKP